MSGSFNPEHRRVKINGIHLHYAEQGRGPVMLCLHGFPEFWYCWRHLMPAFSPGFRVVAPDLRGYNLSDKPEGVAAYQLSVLVEDVQSLIQSLDAGPITLVAHDWGGVIAWALALRYPELINQLVILNAPHPALFARELANNPVQRKASAYIPMLCAPQSEAFLAKNNFKWLQALFDGCHKPSEVTSEDRRAYLEAWAQPGTLTGMVNYYRSETLGPKKVQSGKKVPAIKVPTLVIWGEKDIYLTTGLLDGLEAYVPSLKIKRIPDATHWVLQDAPDKVNRYIREFIK